MHTCTLELKSFHHKILETNQNLIYKFLANFSHLIHISGPVYLPQASKKLVLLRSPFVHKKTQEHFEISNAKLVIKLQSKHAIILNFVINYISKKLIKNLEYKVTKTYIYSI